MEKCGPHLSQSEQEQLFLLLTEYADIFSTSPMDLGHTDKLQHSIHTGTALLIQQQVRRILLHEREEVRKLLDDMLKKDVIQPLSSPWASLIVLVTKKNESMQFCIDYRRPNGVTRKDTYPPPRIDDTLDMQGNTKLFATLDLIS